MHGSYDANGEKSTDAYSSVKNIELVQNDADYSVVNIMFDNKQLLIIQRNTNFDEKAVNSVSVNGKNYSFRGNFTVLYDEKTINN